MELFTIDDEGLHRGIEISLGTEWLCSVSLTAELRARAHEAAEHRAGHALPWATDLRILLGSAAYHAGYTGKRLDISTQEVEKKQAGGALVLVDVHGAPMQDGRDGKVYIEYGGRDTSVVSFTRQLVRTRMLILVGLGGWVEVVREGDTTAGGKAPELPWHMCYELERAGGGDSPIIPDTLHSDRWVRGARAAPGRVALKEGQLTVHV